MLARGRTKVLILGLPGIDGLDVMQLITAHALSTRVLIVTARQDARAVRAALARGAHGYLLKTHDANALMEGVRVVARGGYYVSRELAALASPGRDADSLTPREMETARDVGRGLSSKQIGARLRISEHTVRKHRENIARKLGLRNSAELVAWAIQQGS